MPTTRVRTRPSPADVFPKRLESVADSDQQTAFSERFARVLGEDIMKSVVGSMPRFTDESPGADMHLMSYSTSLVQWLASQNPGKKRGKPDSPYVEWRPAPFKRHPTSKQHGGHAPALQNVDAREDGYMQMYTRIEDDSSQLETIAFVGTQVHPVFERSLLSVSPHVSYSVWHPLNASGAGGSHSQGAIGLTVMSSRLDGSDWTYETGNERGIWDSRVHGPVVDSSGHQINESPDEQGQLTFGQLEAQMEIDGDRRYWAFAYMWSVSDADGSHLFYASNALVLFNAYVDVFRIRQDEIV